MILQKILVSEDDARNENGGLWELATSKADELTNAEFNAVEKAGIIALGSEEAFQNYFAMYKEVQAI